MPSDPGSDPVSDRLTDGSAVLVGPARRARPARAHRGPGRRAASAVVGLGLLSPLGLAACSGSGTVDAGAVQQFVEDASEQTQQIASDVHRLGSQLGSMKSQGDAALTKAQDAATEARTALENARAGSSTLSASARAALGTAYQHLDDARAGLEKLKDELPTASQARATIDDVEKQLDGLAMSITKTEG